MNSLLVLNINPELEEDLVDYLLGLDGIGGFTSYGVLGHGAGTELSLAEQVSGRRKRLQIELMLSQDQATRVVAGLAGNVGGDIVWWEQAVTRSGRIQ